MKDSFPSNIKLIAKERKFSLPYTRNSVVIAHKTPKEISEALNRSYKMERMPIHLAILSVSRSLLLRIE
jgi:hypothetical protein